MPDESRFLNVRFLSLALIVLAAAATRLLPHPPNFTPIAAMALFGGAHFLRRREALLVPLGAMALSDLLLAVGVYGSAVLSSTLIVYPAFALIVGLGWLIRHRRSPLRIAGVSLAGSVSFFVITNFGVWLKGGLYPYTLEGLGACYVAAVPFFRHTLAGDALFALVLFGGFALAQHRFPVLRDPRPVSVQA